MPQALKDRAKSVRITAEMEARLETLHRVMCRKYGIDLKDADVMRMVIDKGCAQLEKKHGVASR